MKTKSLSAAVLLALVSISVSISSSATTPFGVTAHTSATTLSSLMQRIVGSTPYSDAKLNGHLSSSPDLSDALPTTGYFEGGEDLVGVSDGLVLTADANPTNLGVQNISGGGSGEPPLLHLTCQESCMTSLPLRFPQAASNPPQH